MHALSRLPRVRRAGVAATGLTVLVLTACSPTEPDSRFLFEQLSANEEVWSEHGSHRYTLVQTRAWEDDRPPVNVRLEIVDDGIVAATNVDTAAPLDPAQFGTFATVPDLFALVRDALNRRVPGLNVSYDGEVGYIRQLRIDYYARRTDDDVRFTVTSYTAAP